MTSLFIADLHLTDRQPEIYQRFKLFLNSKARNARALYILGDLFEYYLGDDAIQGVIKRVAKDLENLTEKYQTRCYFIAGNRDFLLGKGFSNQLIHLQDESLISLEEHKLILTHADALCTDDNEYQKVRQQLRSPQWQKWFLSQSLAERIAFAKNAREQSKQHTSSSSVEIMDVNYDAVLALFEKHNAQFMLHGHTHRPAFHQINHNGKMLHRMVVGDWHNQISYIEYKNNHFQLLTC